MWKQGGYVYGSARGRKPIMCLTFCNEGMNVRGVSCPAFCILKLEWSIPVYIYVSYINLSALKLYFPRYYMFALFENTVTFTIYVRLTLKKASFVFSSPRINRVHFLNENHRRFPLMIMARSLNATPNRLITIRRLLRTCIAPNSRTSMWKFQRCAFVRLLNSCSEPIRAITDSINFHANTILSQGIGEYRN